MNEKQELYCHSCDQYVQFDLDLSRDDNYDIVCPKCGHHHYRVVKNGKITDTRWGRDATQQQVMMSWGNNYTSISTGTSTSTYSTYATYTGGAMFYNSWSNTTATSIW